MLREKILQQMFITRSALMRECGTAGRDRTLVQHLFHYIFVDCGTATAVSLHSILISLYIRRVCDCGPRTVQHLNFVFSVPANLERA